jgi:FKBP-type peptidyl-prolyl cis-trans isomerase
MRDNDDLAHLKNAKPRVIFSGPRLQSITITMANSYYCIFAALLVVSSSMQLATHAFTTPQSQTRSLQKATSIGAAIVARNGLSYEDIEIGTGRNIFPGDAVLCYYVGTYKESGAIEGGDNPVFAALSKTGGSKTVTFDETEPGDPAEIVVGKGMVIPGWVIGICGDQNFEIPPMKIGGDRKLIIPAELAYGEAGAGDFIPPNTDLQFQIAIVNAERKDPGVSGSTKLKGFAGLIGFLIFMAGFGLFATQYVQNL